MRKRHSKCRGILNKLIIVLLIIALLFLALGLHEQNDKIDILIKRHNQQQVKIEQLEYDSQRLHNVVAYQHGLIRELQKSEKVTVEQPPVIEKKEVHNEEDEKIDMTIDPTPTIVITTLVAIKSLLGRFIPAIP
jgi:hypothetical protein